MRSPERFCPVSWDGEASQSFRVEVAVDAWDRPRLLEDIGRTFAENGCNIVEYGGVDAGPDGQELVRRRGRRREGAEERALGPAQRRVGVRRLPRHAARGPGRLTRADPASATICARRSRTASRPFAASPSTSRKVRRSACWGRTERARRRRCACSARCCTPSGGRATVAGHDVVREAGAVRRAIGFAMQEAGLARYATGREHLLMMGRLYGLSRAQARARARRAADAVRARGGRRPPGAHVLGRHAQAHRPRLRARAQAAPAVPRRAHDGRRPDLARGALGRAAPAAGRGRLAVPDDALPRGGRPPLRPARDRRSRRDRRPRHARTSSRPRSAPTSSPSASATARRGRPPRRSRPLGRVRVAGSGRSIALELTDGAAAVAGIVERLRGAGIVPATITVARPTLDDVFLRYTGATIEEHDEQSAEPAGRR